MMALAGDNFHGDCLVNEGSALVDGMVGLEVAYNLKQFVPESLYQPATPEEWVVFNPFTYINQQPIRKEVMFQIVVGNTEELIAGGKAFYEALKAAGYSPTITEFPDADHYSTASPDEPILRFILEAVQQADLASQ